MPYWDISWFLAVSLSFWITPSFSSLWLFCNFVINFFLSCRLFFAYCCWYSLYVSFSPLNVVRDVFCSSMAYWDIWLFWPILSFCYWSFWFAEAPLCLSMYAYCSMSLACSALCLTLCLSLSFYRPDETLLALIGSYFISTSCGPFCSLPVWFCLYDMNLPPLSRGCISYWALFDLLLAGGIMPLPLPLNRMNSRMEAGCLVVGLSWYAKFLFSAACLPSNLETSSLTMVFAMLLDWVEDAALWPGPLACICCTLICDCLSWANWFLAANSRSFLVMERGGLPLLFG